MIMRIRLPLGILPNGMAARGKTSSPIAKMRMRDQAEQELQRVDIREAPMNCTARSSQPPAGGRTRSLVGTEMMIATRRARNAELDGRLDPPGDQVRDRGTGCKYDLPKSPCTAPTSQFQYCR